MKIKIPLKVGSSKAFTSKDGKRYVKVQALAFGLGIFQFIVPEQRIPDDLEGREFSANFAVYIDRNFELKIGFDGVADGLGGSENA